MQCMMYSYLFWIFGWL